jgi:membrane-associated phospholipid phosphatase
VTHMARLRHSLSAFTFVVMAVPAAAQSVAPVPTAAPVDSSSKMTAVEQVPARDPSASLRLGSLGGEFKELFRPANLRLFGVFAGGSLASMTIDHAVANKVEQSPSRSFFDVGNAAGGFLIQAGAATGTYFAGRITGNARVARLGADLVHAQVLSQAVVQAGKLAAHRFRPDGSNRQSMPSGHTASAFATAGVLQQHFGWKVGAPAYAFAAYVGVSRIEADKHYLSDVVLGAGIGLLASRTVALPIGKHAFEMSVAPTPGGAAVTFSPKRR